MSDRKLEVKKAVVKWMLDEGMEYDLGDLPILKKTGSRARYRNTVDVPANIDAEMKIGGCDRAQALKNTARELDRIRRWHEGDWYFVGCVVTVHYGPVEGTYDEALEDFIDNEEHDSSVWGIESDCGKEYKKQIEAEELSEALHHLKTIYLDIDVNGWDDPAKLETAEDSFYISEPPAEKDIDPVPDDEGKWWELDNDDDTTLIRTCRECGESEQFSLYDFDAEVACCPVCGYPENQEETEE